MPTKRFEKLDPERRRALLEAATTEFATHGFASASLNRIVSAAGTSKGALYYWFEDKTDLFETVVAYSFERATLDFGPRRSPATVDAFWVWVGDVVLASCRIYQADPMMSALARAVLTAPDASGAIATYQAQLLDLLRPFVEEGLRLGAIRTDLPPDLLLTLASSLGQGIDLWLARRAPDLDDAELVDVAAKFTDAYRRLGSPQEPA
jgi:AcrR family transcriptional regulator